MGPSLDAHLVFTHACWRVLVDFRFYAGYYTAQYRASRLRSSCGREEEEEEEEEECPQILTENEVHGVRGTRQVVIGDDGTESWA